MPRTSSWVTVRMWNAQRKSYRLACVLAAALLVALEPPPRKLVDFIGSDVWTRLGLFVLVTIVLLGFLIAFGLLAGKVGLPFGISLESAEAEPRIADQTDALEALLQELQALRHADERIFERIGGLTSVIEASLERIAQLERRVLAPPRRPPEANPSGAGDDG